MGRVVCSAAAAGALMLSSVAAAAQVNVEPLRLQVKRGGLGGRLALSMTASGGNTDRLLMGATGLLGGHQGPHFAYLTLAGEYGRAKEQTTVAKAFSHLRYNLQLAPWLWGETFGQLEADRFRRVARRELLGLGPRVGHDGEALGLFYGSSYMPEWVLLSRSDTIDSAELRFRHRWNNYATVRLRCDERVLLVATGYYQPRIDDFGDYTLLLTPEAVFKITNVLSAKLQGAVGYESRPPEQVQALDYAITNALEATF